MITRLGQRITASLTTALVMALWIGLAAVAVIVTHDFFRYVDRAIFVSVDDSEANIAYALASQGRYGFFASPVLAGMDRTHGQFNYGPWYFYLAGGLIWLFGYSLTLVRSIHLWGVIASIGIAAFWFRGRNRAAATVLYGLGILYCFDVSHWPMARPDILVSVFALLFIVCAGLAMLRSRPAYWFGAGVAAVCGAFTHLIAVSLVPSVGLLFLLNGWQELHSVSDNASADRLDARSAEIAVHRAAWRRILLGGLALTAGVLVGLAMFYASFGFRFATQLRFFAAYRELTGNSDTFATALGHHLTYAFGYLSRTMQLVVGLTLGTGWAISALALRCDRSTRREILAYVLPPVVAWSSYLVTNGVYTNYHQGYAILHQVLFLWTLAAIVWVVLQVVERRYPRTGVLLAMTVVALLLVQTGRQLIWQLTGASWKIEKIATWVPFSEYSARVLGAIPARSTAWGTVILGIEAPDRIQLIQWADATTLFARMDPARRRDLSPDFIVWGYPEARDNMLSATRGGGTLLGKTTELIGDSHLRLVGLVAGAPYGVTRTYARYVGELDPSRALPMLNVYDADHQQWLTRLAPAAPAAFAAAEPAVLHIGYEANPPASIPTRTIVADLAANPYLLRIALKPGTGPTPRRLLAVTSPNMLRQTIGEGGPDGDFASYLESDTQVFMLSMHSGGPLYISQFDDSAGAAIEGVTAFPIIGELDPREQPSYEQNLPNLKSWTPTPGVQALIEGDTIRVSGDDTAGGYQLTSPLIPARERHVITVRAPLRVEQGEVCAGALNGNGLSWLVPPDIVRAQLHFTMDATQGFRVVLVNCNRRGAAEKSRFVIWPGTFLDEAGGELYVDRLVTAALTPTALKAPEPAGPEVQRFPAGLTITKAAVDGPLAALSPADVAFRAPLLKQTGDTWTASGTADGAFTYLLQSKERKLAKGDRLLVAGRVEQGGLSIGLLKNNQWAGQVNITDPGEFTVVVAPPSAGSYALVVANDLAHGLDTSIVLSKVGIITSK